MQSFEFALHVLAVQYLNSNETYPLLYLFVYGWIKIEYKHDGYLPMTALSWNCYLIIHDNKFSVQAMKYIVFRYVSFQACSYF